MTIEFKGIDQAENVFQLHGVDADGNAVFERRIRSEALLTELADLPPDELGSRPAPALSIGSASFEALSDGSN